MKGIGVRGNKVCTEAFRGIRNSFSDDYEPISMTKGEYVGCSMNTFQMLKSDHKSNIYDQKLKQGDIQRKLENMYLEEDKLKEEMQYTSSEFEKIGEKLIKVARMYEVDKFNLHILEIEKIMALILGLKQ